MKLSSIFQHGAVLQRQLPIPVWGWSEPKTLIKATLADAESYTRTADDGKFLLRLPPLPAGGPYKLTVTAVASGDCVVVEDVLIGDVWIASGQSNMEYRLGSTWTSDDGTEKPLKKLQKEEYCQTIPDAMSLRFFTVAQTASGIVETDVSGEWLAMTPENALKCSAVAAWFGRFVQMKTHVPLGIIHASWGGTIVEAWTSRAALLRNPITAPAVSMIDAQLARKHGWLNNETPPKTAPFEEYTQVDSGNTGVDKGWASPNLDDAAWKNMVIPGSWIRQNIGKNGAFWFRKKIMIPVSWAGHDLILETGGIDKHDITYFNGHEIGRTGKAFETNYWDAHRRYTIPAEYVQFGCTNVIAIRAFSFSHQGAFWGKPEDYALRCAGTDESIGISGDWKAQVEYDMGFTQMKSRLLCFAPNNENTYGILFDGMIKPLIPYGIKGVIWYQGESNDKSPQDGRNYRANIRAMIQDWRYQWGQGDFSFFQVQLANFRTPARYSEDIWPLLRESQRRVCEDIPMVFMSPTLDIGDANDIHPQNKKDVGKRLADNALANAYDFDDAVPNGPMLKDIRLLGHEIRIQFTCADGLHLLPDGEKSFWLAGTDNVFHPADCARIDHGCVTVSCEKVPVPTRVRYAWADNPVATLFNSAGLPASPFSSF